MSTDVEIIKISFFLDDGLFHAATRSYRLTSNGVYSTKVGNSHETFVCPPLELVAANKYGNDVMCVLRFRDRSGHENQVIVPHLALFRPDQKKTGVIALLMDQDFEINADALLE